MKPKKKFINDEKFVTEKFEWLVKRYGGQTIIIANGEIFTGDNAAKEARKKYPRIISTIFSVPRSELFSHHFLL